MSLYIIITNTIYGFGGGQLLTLRKAKLLQKKNFKVIIIYKARYGEFKLEGEYKAFECHFIPEFGKPYNFVSSKRRFKILNELLEVTKGYEIKGSIIESHDTYTAIWGEVLSQKMQIPHVLYLIKETNMNRLHYYPYKSFFKYKLHRNEFWGCNSRGIDLSFGKSLPEFKDNYINVPFDESEVPLISKPVFTKSNWNESSKMVITTVTRLDKDYLKPLIKKIEAFSNQNKNINFELIVVGGTVYPEAYQEIKEIESAINKKNNNYHIILTGYLVPGKELYDYTDVFIGTGTAVINAISQKCITIPYNSYTNKTPGIFGLEAKNFAYAEEGELEFDVLDILTKIISLNEEQKALISRQSYNFFVDNFSLEGTWTKQNRLLEKLLYDNKTYNFNRSHIFCFFDVLFFIASQIRDCLK